MNRIAIRLLIILLPFFLLSLSATAQKGYIYVHVSALNEESSPDFQFSISGGPSAITDFYLNDQPFITDRVYDIGASHPLLAGGPGDGELWCSFELSRQIYHRMSGSSQWTATGLTGTSIDGAGPGQFVSVDANGNAYFFNGSTQQLIYSAAVHGGEPAVDISYGSGYIAIVTDNGSVLVNNGISMPYTDVWTMLTPPGSARRLDIQPSAAQIAYLNAGGAVFTLPANGGTVTGIGNPGAMDIAFDDNGTLYGNGFRWGGGTTWIPDMACNGTIHHITAGPAGQVWGTVETGTIYTRSSRGTWIDDERPRTPYKGNAVLLPVDAGIYTLSAIIPAGWSLEEITIYDPSSNSAVSAGTAQASVNVAAGEVVHVIVDEALLAPVSISQACGVNFTDDFGSGAPAPLVTTSYHYSNNSNIGDGYYTIAASDKAGSITDHTTGTGNMMLVNATAQGDVLYRKRLTNLLPGKPYRLSYWVANTNTAAAVKPEIIAGMASINGALVSAFSTGAITSGNWTQYIFTFDAPAGSADIFLQNAAVGSDGAELALDDIVIMPMSGILPSNTLTPAASGICAGATGMIANSTSGGVWSTSNAAVARVDADGRISAISAGYADITYTVTDNIGCESAAITSITIYPPPAVTATVDKTSICVGGSVSLSATVNNTLAPYTYQWSSSPADGNIADNQLQYTTANPATIGSNYEFSVKAVDVRGCAATVVTAAVSVRPLPEATISYPEDHCRRGIATVTQTGTTGGTYSGTAGLVIDPATGTIDLETSTARKHKVKYIFTDGQCTDSAIATINIHAGPTPGAITGTFTVCEGGQVTLRNTSAAGVWSSRNNTIATVDAAGIVRGIAAGTTSIVYTVTDKFGCSDSVSANITVNARPIAAIAYERPVYCYKGTADVQQTGIGGGTFSADAGLVIDAQTGRLDLGASQPGSYTVKYTFTNGTCTNVATTSVTVEGRPFVAPITGNNLVCPDNRGTDLSCLTAGGVWSSSDAGILTVSQTGHVTGLNPGTAVVSYEITTRGGCVNRSDFTMEVAALPTFTTSVTPATCSYARDGSIVVQVPAAGYKYALNAADWKEENTFSDLRSGDYNIQVMDERGCISGPEKITVPAPAAIGLIVTPKDITCHGESTGSLSLTAAGGTLPYRVTWSTGATGNKISNLPAGQYNVTVTDKNGCSSSIGVELKELFPVFTVDNPVKQEGGLLTISGKAIPKADILVVYPDGSITTTHTDARGNFSTLSPGVVASGTITVTVTDPISKGNCVKYIDFNNSTTSDLFVVKTISINDAPTIGDEATFTITVNNKGLDHATQVIVTDDISNMLEDVVNIAATAGNTVFNTRTRQVVWTIDTVYVNKPLQLLFTTRITRGGLLENTAVVSGREDDPDQSNNVASIKPVEISPDLFLPNLVTANGDGKNDYFVVRGIEQYPGSILEIYNRWGNQVYYSGNYSNNWGGAGLSAGIYYYVLKINLTRTVKVYKGYIELIQK